MLAAALGWVPVIGPVLQGLFSTFGTIYSKFKDTQLGMRQADVSEAQISAQIIQTTNDDIALRILRDIYCLPAVVHVMLVGWDTILAENTWVDHKYMWHTASFPDATYGWYTLSVAAFLLGNIGLNMWKRWR